MSDNEVCETENEKYFFYAILCNFQETVFIKFGKTNNLKHRIRNIQTGCPHKIIKIFVSTSDFEEEIIGVEKLIHFKLKDHCINGEWYIASVKFIELFQEEWAKINNGEYSWDEINNISDEIAFDSLEIVLHKHEYYFYEVKKEKGAYKKIRLLEINEFLH